MKSRVAYSLMYIKNALTGYIDTTAGTVRNLDQFVTHLYCTVAHTAVLSPAFGAANVQW